MESDAVEQSDGCDAENESKGSCKGEANQDSEKEKLFGTLGILEIAGITGFGFYLAELYLIMSCHVVPGSLGIGFDARNLVFAFIFGEIFISVLLVVIARYLTKPSSTKIVSAFAGIALSMPGITSFFCAPEILFVFAWFLAGLGSVVLLALWGYFLAQLTYSKTIIVSALSVLVAGFCLLVMALLFKDEAWPLANVLAPCLSTLLFYAWVCNAFSKDEFPNFENVRPHDVRSLLHSAAAMVANSFLLGFGFCIMASLDSTLFSLAVVLAIVFAAIYKVIDVQRKVRYQVGTIISVIAPIAAIEFSLLPYVSSPVALVIVGVSMLIAMVNEIVCWSAVACYMHVYQVHPFANAGFGRIGDVVGLGLGFGYGLASLGATYDDWLFGLFRALVVIAFIAIQVFFFQDNYKPFTEHSSMNEDLAETLPSPVEEEHHVGAWRQNLLNFAQHYELTARQTEVLTLLAKGYSTSKIEETLVVSNHTVKAHIYGIYQKTDVHARQELIELIEQFSANSAGAKR